MADTSWIDKEEYQFKSNYLKLDMGKMHHIGKGKGSPIVMVHGNFTRQEEMDYHIDGQG